MGDANGTAAVERGEGVADPATSSHEETGGHPSCSLCHTDAEWHGSVSGVVELHACDLCRARAEVDAEVAGYGTIWRALTRDAGGLAAVCVVFLAPFLLPGCDAAGKPDPLFVALGVIVAVLLIVWALVRFGPRSWFCPCAGDGCVDCEEAARP